MALDLSQIHIDTTVSFDLYPAHFLGTSIKNAKVLGLVTAAMAMKMGFDAPAVHAAVYPTLPSGTPNGYDKYQYVVLKLTNGDSTYIGVPWIKEATYVEEVIRNITIVIENVTPDQQNRIVAAISAVGSSVSSLMIS